MTLVKLLKLVVLVTGTLWPFDLPFLMPVLKSVPRGPVSGRVAGSTMPVPQQRKQFGLLPPQEQGVELKVMGRQRLFVSSGQSNPSDRTKLQSSTPGSAEQSNQQPTEGVVFAIRLIHVPVIYRSVRECMSL